MRLIDLIGDKALNRAHTELDFDAEINGLTADSRRVQAGFLFAALPGTRTDGAQFISQALERGAVAVLAPPGTRFADPASRAVLLTDGDPRRLYAKMAARFFGRQPENLAAVTGTNGKSSVADFARQIWTRLGLRAASLGTLGAQAPGLEVAANLTTPDPVELHQQLARFAELGVTHGIIEASSHGLHQSRLAGAEISIAAFTNLSRDHLDYHATEAAYLRAKLSLFSDYLAPGGTAVLNADDAQFAAFERAARQGGARVFSYGRLGRDLRLEDLQARAQGQLLTLTLRTKGARQVVELPLIGAFQAMNALCALGVVLAAPGAEADDGGRALAQLEHLSGVPGRLQLVARHPGGGAVYVDYAHTPHALESVLLALRPHVEGRLGLVFGCGGERDTGKRGEMGAIAGRLADEVIVTDDNPRSEDAAAIRAEIVRHCPGAREIGERGRAIRAALRTMRPGDLRLIAGKGHERGQIIGTETIPFNDAEAVSAAMKELEQ